MKLAICNVADTGPLESLVVMLRTVGYTCVLPDRKLKDYLRLIGVDTVVEIHSLVSNMGYDAPIKLPEVGISAMQNALYVDVKAHRNFERVRAKFPNQEVLWYRINGGEPSNTKGDELNPPCPVLTPNQWYKGRDDSYTCWPPFFRMHEYLRKGMYDDPVCLTHNLVGWGYGKLLPAMRKLGVKCYGNRSPDGAVEHKYIPGLLATAKCLVHLKMSDAPGYSLYEALSAACPIICSRKLIARNRMEELFEPGETCLVFDDVDGESNPDKCVLEILSALQVLGSQRENWRIGEAGRARLKSIMWSSTRNAKSLKDFMERMYRCKLG